MKHTIYNKIHSIVKFMFVGLSELYIYYNKKQYLSLPNYNFNIL